MTVIIARLLFLGVMVLLFTNARILLAYHVGISSLTDVYFLFFPLLITSLLLVPRSSANVIKKRSLAGWVGLIFVVPSFITLVHLALGYVGAREAVYSIGKAAFFATLLVACAAYIAKWPDLGPKLGRWLIATIIMGVVLELVAPSYVATVKQAVVTDGFIGERQVRGSGLFLNPNLLGMACVLWLVWRMSNGDKVVKMDIAWIVAAVVSVLMSGSRTSLLILLSVVMFITWGEVARRSTLRARTNKLIAAFVVGVAVLLTSSLLLRPVGSHARWNEVVHRFSTLPDVVFNLQGTEDGSVRARVNQLVYYVEKVFEGALIGKGARYPAQLVAEGEFRHASQNTFVDYALAYGIPYVCLIGVAWVLMLKRARDERDRQGYPLRRATLVFVVVSVLYSFSVDFMFAIESYVIMLGLLLGMAVQRRMQRRDVRVGRGLTYPSGIDPSRGFASKRNAGRGQI